MGKANDTSTQRFRRGSGDGMCVEGTCATREAPRGGWRGGAGRRWCREARNRPLGVADGVAVLVKPGNAGGGKDPWSGNGAGRSEREAIDECARSCQHRSRTKGPSLHRHCPASPVLRPHPPPQGAGSVPRDTTVGQRRHANHPEGLPVLHTFPLRTCRRHYPGGTVGCSCRSPSPTAAAFPESQAGRLPHCPFRDLLGVHRSLRPVRSLSPFGPFSIRSFGSFVTSTTVPTATGWNDPCRVGLAPTETVHLCTAH